MGLFGGKEEYLNVSFSRLYQKNLRNLLETVGYAVAAPQDFNPALISYLTNTQAITAGDLAAYYNYGKDLPWSRAAEKSVINRANIDEVKLKQELANKFNLTLEDIGAVTGQRWESDVEIEVAMAALTSESGYNPVTNRLSDSVMVNPFYNINFPAKAYLDSIYPRIVRLDENDGVQYYFSTGAYLRIEEQNTGLTKYYSYDSRVEYVPIEFDDDGENERIGEVEIRRVMFEYQGTWYTAYFSPEDSDITSVYDVTVSTGNTWAEFYPWIPIKKDWKYSSPKNSGVETYNEIKRLSNIIKLDIDSVVQAVKGSQDQQYIQDSFVHAGIDLATKEEASLEYLFNYFRDYYPSQVTDKPLPNSIQLLPPYPGYNGYSIQFSFTHLSILDHQVISNPNRGDYNIAAFGVFGSGTYTISKRNPATGRYTSITLHNPRYTVHIQGSSKAYADARDIGDAIAKNGSVSFVRLPIIEQRVSQLESKKQGLIGIDAFGVEVGTYQEEDVEWYESSFFTFILQFVAVVITLVSFGTASSFSSLLYNLALQVAVGYIVKVIIEGVGGDLGTALAVAFAVLSRDLSNIKVLLKTVSVEAILAITQTVLMVTEIALANEESLLQSEIDEYRAELEAHQERLEAAYDLLGDPYDPTGFMQGIAEKDLIIVESSSEFIDRTIHAGNIGPLTLGFPERYVDISLDINESLSDEIDYIIV